MNKFLKKSWAVFAAIVVTLAILISLFRALTPWAKQYKNEVEHHLEKMLGQPVSIQGMETSWYWFEPVLKLNGITIEDQHHKKIEVDKLLVGINVFSSLWHWQFQPGILYVDNAHLNIKQENQHWEIDGLNATQQFDSFDPDAFLPLVNWLLDEQKIIIRNVSADIHLNDGSVLPIKEVNITTDNRGEHYRMKGYAKLNQAVPTEFSILADMDISPGTWNETSGRIYFSLAHFLPTQWQSFFPDSNVHIEKGEGKIEAWLDINNGTISQAQTVLNFADFAWGSYGKPLVHKIQAFHANLAWKPKQKGWILTGDKIHLKMQDDTWPENKLQIQYNPQDEAYQIYVKNLLIAPLLVFVENDTDKLRSVRKFKPQGELFDTQIAYKNKEIDYILTRFNHLGWSAKDSVPGMSELKGVLSWQPNEGRLDLDSENAVLTPYKLPPIKLTKLNGTFDWKQLSEGMRLSVDRLILIHPNLVLSARGILDNAQDPEARRIQLSAEFSAENAQLWTKYLPSKYIKAKLDRWLKKDVKRIGKANGQFRLFGLLADFPFDKNPGEFSLTTHLNGVDLYINDQWPLTRNIDAYLRINKRKMDIDVMQADMQGIAIKNVNLLMDDLGLNHETLLIHGKVDAPASKVMAYIFKTPLSNHLQKLKRIEIKGPLNLDLRFEIPLYPENDDVLSQGLIVFKNNRVIAHHTLKNIELQDVNGSLQFDEHGVTDSALQATLLGDPVSMFIQSVRAPHPYTEVRVEGTTTIELLKNKLNLALLSFLKGHLKLTCLLTITDDPDDLDHIRIASSLEGVKVDLPAPLGKSFNEITPLIVDVDFNPKKAFRVRVNYNKKVSSDLWFANLKQGTVLKRGEIVIGGGAAKLKDQPGVKILGVLPLFDLSEWRKVFNKIPTDTSSPKLIDSIHALDLSIGTLKLGKSMYTNVGLEANQLAKDDWKLKVQHDSLTADLRYQSIPNILSGQVSHLYLEPNLTATSTHNDFSDLKPEQIPNLDLNIENLKVGKLDIGSVTLKSSSLVGLWQIEHCKVSSPDYQIAVKGNWKKNADENQTNLQVNLQMQNLAGSLKRWNVSPVVEARRGTVDFEGGWHGGIQDFAIAKTYGSLQMSFKNGRITNLSPETESKLGMGKLLSILSLQTIPRRLKLDFSDLSNDGYSFDEMQGSFQLKNGVLSTTDSYIEGPVAYASMTGNLNLPEQLYDVELHVAPHITASLPVVATIAGGPIAGLATWVASKLINRGMQKISGYTYKVTGPWHDPVVQQVSIIKKMIKN